MKGKEIYNNLVEKGSNFQEIEPIVEKLKVLYKNIDNIEILDFFETEDNGYPMPINEIDRIDLELDKIDFGTNMYNKLMLVLLNTKRKVNYSDYDDRKNIIINKIIDITDNSQISRLTHLNEYSSDKNIKRHIIDLVNLLHK